MIDHTIQTGNGKCFVVFGIQLSDWNAKRQAALEADPQASFALEHQDLSVFAIERMASSTGELVHEQLEQLSESTGITPRVILSDQGSDVRLGAKSFCKQEDRPTVIVHDIAHGVACAIKRQLNGNPAWDQFLSDANRSKTQLRQTPYAFSKAKTFAGLIGLARNELIAATRSLRTAWKAWSTMPSAVRVLSCSLAWLSPQPLD